MCVCVCVCVCVRACVRACVRVLLSASYYLILYSSIIGLLRAQSGTGKTATFSIAALQKVDIQLRETQVLVLSPTRELAVQIQKVRGFASFLLYRPMN